MLAFDKARLARPVVPVTAAGVRDGQIYDAYAAGLYGQALLTLDDAGMAEQVVCDVLVAECVRPLPPEASADSVRNRLAVSAYRRCQELNAAHERHDDRAMRQPAGTLARCAGSVRLSRRERGALGLVLFGGVRYVEATGELAISPPDMALLRAVRHKLTAAGTSLPAGSPRTAMSDSAAAAVHGRRVP
jgi:hypothetical protein